MLRATQLPPPSPSPEELAAQAKRQAAEKSSLARREALQSGNYVCSKCEETKLATAFFRDPAVVSALTSQCKDCRVDFHPSLVGPLRPLALSGS